MKVTVSVPVPQGKAELASGGAITSAKDGDKTVYTIDLGEGDVIIVR
jgi:hypothetical protein